MVLQVILTVYELVYHLETFGGPVNDWAIWAKVTKEVSHTLLLLYAALNPIAYCGSLMATFMWKIVRKLCCVGQTISSKSELEMMRSVGITLNGADPIEQQLRELDAQSRILTGIRRMSTKEATIEIVAHPDKSAVSKGDVATAV